MKRRTAIAGSVALLGAALSTAYLVFPEVRSFTQRLLTPRGDIAEIRQVVGPRIAAALETNGLELGAETFLRVFKEERTLEVWLRDGEVFHLFRTYEVCNFSGELGPKLREGDRQSPEGFYAVDRSALNPNSSYHLSFNLGFPNRFDRAHDRTGSYLMIHGDCVSIGCYAMTDEGIEEIYIMVEAALANGQEAVPVHIFPFRMTAERLDLEKDAEWHSFWANLKAGYDLFEAAQVPPRVNVVGGRYDFARG